MGSPFINKIRSFLKEKDLIYFMIAVYVGTILNNFLSSFTNSIIIPLISMLIPKSLTIGEKMGQILEDLGFVELRKLETDFISLIISILVSYYLIRFVIGAKGKK
jgi:large-conductance mechanosensitive channel